MEHLPIKTMVRFTATISAEGRGNGLPDQIFAFLLFEGFDRQVVTTAIDAQLGAFIRMNGLAVSRDQGQVVSIGELKPEERMYVPMKWIVHIVPDLINLTHELSLPDEEGVECLSNGEEPVKQ